MMYALPYMISGWQTASALDAGNEMLWIAAGAVCARIRFTVAILEESD